MLLCSFWQHLKLSNSLTFQQPTKSQCTHFSKFKHKSTNCSKFHYFPTSTSRSINFTRSENMEHGDDANSKWIISCPKTQLHKILHQIQASIYEHLGLIFSNIYFSKFKFAWCANMEHGANKIAKRIISFCPKLDLFYPLKHDFSLSSRGCCKSGVDLRIQLSISVSCSSFAGYEILWQALTR